MEPIVLLGLVVVAYGGYVSVLDLWADLSALMPRAACRASINFWQKGRGLQPQVKKMAGMNV